MDRKSRGDRDMVTNLLNQKEHQTQSSTFLKLRRKFQNQMKKNEISYEDILRNESEKKSDE